MPEHFSIRAASMSGMEKGWRLPPPKRRRPAAGGGKTGGARTVGIAFLVDGVASGYFERGHDFLEMEELFAPRGRASAEVEEFPPAGDFVEAGDAQRGEQSADILGHVGEEGGDVVGVPLEFRPQLLVLGGDTDGASVEIALAAGDAAHGEEGGGSKGEFPGAQYGGDDDVSGGAQPAVYLHDDIRVQAVHREHLSYFRQSRFPCVARIVE